MEPKSNALDHSAKLSSCPTNEYEITLFNILKDTQLKIGRDEQGTKRIQDFLLVVVFYVKNRLLHKDKLRKALGSRFGTTYNRYTLERAFFWLLCSMSRIDFWPQIYVGKGSVR